MKQTKQTKQLKQKKRIRRKIRFKKIRQYLHIGVTFGVITVAGLLIIQFILSSLQKTELPDNSNETTIVLDESFYPSENKVEQMSSPKDLLSSIQDAKIESIEQAQTVIANYAQLHNHTLEEYPYPLIELFVKNKDARSFVLDYPDKKEETPVIDFGEYASCDSVPLLMQWDSRWGYKQYAGDVMGLTGCGPTCLSMVAIYLTHDLSLTPAYIADFSAKNGYSVDGKGSAWTLISKGGKKLGMRVTEIPLDEERIIANLTADNPIICIMGAGDFTDSGHFIVLTGYHNGTFTINDPNSYANSEKTWTFEQLQHQIRNLWVYQQRK